MIAQSNSKNNINSELTSEEEATLTELLTEEKKSRETISIARKFGDDTERRILASLLHFPFLLAESRVWLKPEYFATEYYVWFMKQVGEFFDKYEEAPDKDLMRQKTIDAYDDKPVQNYYLAELETMYDSSNAMVVSSKVELFRRVEEYVKDQYWKMEFGKMITTAKDKPFAERPAMAQEFAEKISKFSVGKTEYTGLNLKEIFATEENPQDWFIEDWLQSGALTLFTAEPKKGKTTLYWYMVACLITGRSFFGHQVKQSPVLVLDYERNSLSELIVPHLKAFLGDTDINSIFEKISYPTSPVAPLNAFNLKRYCKEFFKGESGVVIADSIRRFNPGMDENSAGEVSACLKPLSEAARDLNVGVLAIHHNNRRDEYSGSGDFLGASDHVLTLKSEGDGRVLSYVAGRTANKYPDPIYYVKDEFQLVALNRPNPEQERFAAEFSDFLKLIPTSTSDEANRDNTTRHGELVEKTGWGKNKVTNFINKAKNRGAIDCKRDGRCELLYKNRIITN